MVYFFLLLLALDFWLFGFLLHAFYFGKPAKKVNIADEVANLRNALTNVEKGTQGALEEIAGNSTLVRSLEQQLRQKDEEVEELRIMAQRQEKQIGLLQKAAAEIGVAIAGNEESPSGSKAAQPEASCAQDEIATQSPPAQSEAAQDPQAEDHSPADAADKEASTESKDKNLPSWRDNLNSILSILDTMEKEVEK